jgi:hypothetical protein
MPLELGIVGCIIHIANEASADLINRYEALKWRAAAVAQQEWPILHFVVKRPPKAASPVIKSSE